MLHDLAGRKVICTRHTQCRHSSVLFREGDLGVATGSRQHWHRRFEVDSVNRRRTSLCRVKRQVDDVVVDRIWKIRCRVQRKRSGRLNILLLHILGDDLEAADHTLINRIPPAGTRERDGVSGCSSEFRVRDLIHLLSTADASLRDSVLISGSLEAR